MAARSLHFAAAIGVILFTAALGRAADIIAGPMVGHVTDRSARIWMQLSIAKKVTIECYDETDSATSAVSIDVEGPLPFVCDLPVNSLKPNKTYRIVVKLNDEVVRPPAPDVVIRTTPAPGEEAAFTVAFGSGVNPHGPGTAPIFKAIDSVKPRAFVFLGNTGLLPEKLDDFPTTRRKAFRFLCDFDNRIRSEPDLQQLFRTAACYGIWGERDFGAVGSNKDWVYARESQAAFQRFWANPDWGTPENPGCYTTFSMGDVDFFLLDDRMFRDGDTDPVRKTMLGDAQLAWLKKGLSESRATFKIIACASDLLSDYSLNAWKPYQPEQGNFVRWLFDNRISGCMFATGSGGRPWGELNAFAADKSVPNSYPLVEMATSSLTVEKPSPASAPASPAPNVDRLGLAVTDANFATFDFGGIHEHRFVTLRLRDQSGKIRAEQTIFATQLMGH